MSVVIIGRGPPATKAHVRPCGRRNGNAKLYARTVRWIRKVYVPYHPEFSASALGRKLGVSHERIRDIVRGRAWKHLL